MITEILKSGQKEWENIVFYIKEETLLKSGQAPFRILPCASYVNSLDLIPRTNLPTELLTNWVFSLKTICLCYTQGTTIEYNVYLETCSF